MNISISENQPQRASKRYDALIPENGCPREHKNHLHIKQKKHQRNHIKAGIEGQPGVAGRFFAAFVGAKFLSIRVSRCQQSVHAEQQQYHYNACN
jgi:hypothetical protein